MILYIQKRCGEIANETTRDQMTQLLTTIGHRTAFNNEQRPYRIVSYKRPRNDNVKQFKRENYFAQKRFPYK